MADCEEGAEVDVDVVEMFQRGKDGKRSETCQILGVDVLGVEVNDSGISPMCFCRSEADAAQILHDLVLGGSG